MKSFSPPRALVALLALLTLADALRKSTKSVLLSDVKTLTLRKDAKTAHRRVSSIPQLTCIGGTAGGLYEIDVLRCTNAGSDYDEASIQWTCKAPLPPEFKLGSTDVVCEGYDSPEDPFVLKGSCGVEYRLMLTEAGEKKYGKRQDYRSGEEEEGSSTLVAWFFWTLFIGVVLFMVYSALTGNGDARGGQAQQRRPRAPREPRGGTYFGGGGGGNDDDDPPPPYDHQPGSAPPRKSRSTEPPSANIQASWRPGFWSGAAGGAAAGYMAGRRGGGGSTQQGPGYNQAGPSGWFGGGSRRNGSGNDDSGSSAPSSSRYESTGFGETRRR